MKIVADENMPLIEECFSEYGEIKRLAGRSIQPEDVVDADVLLVRSVTLVNEALLKGSKVKFVGTATIGTDHLDKKYMDAAGVCWRSAPGCNADSVAEYDVSILAYLSKMEKVNLSTLKVGVVGCGNVGSRVIKRLDALGLNYCVYDPPKAEREVNFHSCSLAELTECDLFCFHAPLTYEGSCPSFHMIDYSFFKSIKKEFYVISAGRGPVIDFSALKECDLTKFFLDVWEPEPDIPQSVLKSVKGATPHVAGYSIQSKWRGSLMIYDEACKYFNWQKKDVSFPETPPERSLKGVRSWEEAVLNLYDPLEDTKRTKGALLDNENVSDAFDKLRKQYPLRHEFSFPKFTDASMPDGDQAILRKLGFNL